MHFLLLIVYGILNRCRGSAVFPKAVCYALFGVLACVTSWMDGLTGNTGFWVILWVIAFGGSYYGFAHCWGKYFPTTLDTSAQVCVPIVDEITTKIYGPYTSTTPPEQTLNWKTIAMSWRWMIFFAPKYLFMAAFHAWFGAPVNSMAFAFAICILLLAIVGPIYRISFTICASKPQWQQYNVATSEVITGICVIGVCDWVLLA